MDKEHIAEFLSELALVLELDGANPFKVRAYDKAARIVESLPDDLSELVRDDGLVKIEGIGRNLADHIAELFATGTISEYETLIKSVPPGVNQMLRIPGLGPRKVHHLWKGLNVTTLGELETCCKRHLLSEEPGFGAKTEEKILEGLEMFKRFAGKHRFDEALSWALMVHAEVDSWQGVIRAEIAGSIRRRKEIVKDVDILVATNDSSSIMDKFVSMPQVERVLQYGETKSEVMLSSGIQCDLRAVDNDQYPFALHYFTGSKEHNVEMRRVAKNDGYKLNEYGLFKSNSMKSLKCSGEEGIFKALGLDFIPPELREGMGEVQAAMKHELPSLVCGGDMKGVIHVHSTYTDGDASIEEMALAAKKLGYEYMVMADHSQAVTIAGGMNVEEVERQHEEVDRIDKQLKGFRVLKGIEVDVLADGLLDYDDELLSRFDLVIAAIHSRFGMGEDEMTRRIVRAVSNPNVDVLAHPTGRLLLSRESYAVDMNRVIDACVDNGVALEINAHPQRLDLDWRWCKYAKGKGAKMSIGPDAHSVDGIECIAFGVGIARKGWLEKSDIINCLDADALIESFS